MFSFILDLFLSVSECLAEHLIWYSSTQRNILSNRIHCLQWVMAIKLYTARPFLAFILFLKMQAAIKKGPEVFHCMLRAFYYANSWMVLVCDSCGCSERTMSTQPLSDWQVLQIHHISHWCNWANPVAPLHSTYYYSLSVCWNVFCILTMIYPSCMRSAKNVSLI